MGDCLSLRMSCKPPFTVTQKFFDLLVAHPVMLLVIQDRREDVEMREQLAQPHACRKLDRKIRALSPLREFLIKGVPLRRHLIAERLKQTAQELFAAATWKHGYLRAQRQRSISQLLVAFTLA